MASTVKIVNKNTNPTVVAEPLNFTVISPTGITNPAVPYNEYMADIASVNDGSVYVPLFNKVQYFKLPAGHILTLQIADDNANEFAYYKQLEVAGCDITVTGTTSKLEEVSIVFDKTTMTAAGSITATTTPAGQTVTWASSDETVATVSSGTVTKVANGTAIITGTITVDGITAIASCTVTFS